MTNLHITCLRITSSSRSANLIVSKPTTTMTCRNKKCSPVLVAASLQTIEHTISLHCTVHVKTQEQLTAYLHNLITAPSTAAPESNRLSPLHQITFWETRLHAKAITEATPYYSTQSVPRGLNKQTARTFRPPEGRLSRRRKPTGNARCEICSRMRAATAHRRTAGAALRFELVVVAFSSPSWAVRGFSFQK